MGATAGPRVSPPRPPRRAGRTPAARLAAACLLALALAPRAAAFAGEAALSPEDAAFLSRLDGLDALTVEVRTFPKPGADLASVLADTDWRAPTGASVEVLFRCGGYGAERTRPNARMRLRGHSTREGQKKSFKIELYRDVKPWAGYRSINLNKHPFDLTMMRNKLAFDLLSGVPHIPTLRTAFARLLVDGEDQGLHTIVETYTKRFFKARGLDPRGWLYRAEDFEFQRYGEALRPESDPAFSRAAFETRLRIEGRTDHAPLLDMLDAVNDPARDIDETVARWFDRENYLTWFAVNILFDNMDTNAQNFFLYRAGEGGPWLFLPWDYDGAFGYYEQPNAAERRKERPLWWHGVANWWGVALHRRFLSKPANLRDLAERVDRLAAERFPESRVRALVARYRETVAPFASRPPDIDRWCLSDGANTPEKRIAEWAGEVERLSRNVETNRRDFHDSLDRPLPVFLGDLEPLGEGNFAFRWEPSVDLQGDAVFYDAALSTGPRFATGEVLFEARGTTATEVILPLRARAGDRFYGRLLLRDATGHEQHPFDIWWDAEEGRGVPGMRELPIR